MTYLLLTISTVVIAIIIFIIAARLLFRNRWFLAWLRGMTGMILLLSAGILGFIALDLYGYKQLTSDKHIATLAFHAKGHQHYTVNLVDNLGSESNYELYGDLWQLDARLLRWHPKTLRLGIKPGYKLERLAGRYLSIEQEQQAKRSVHGLNQSYEYIDLWAWLHQYGEGLELVSAQYGSATYMPMADNALFAVYLSTSGLVAKPLNEPAEATVSQWQ